MARSFTHSVLGRFLKSTGILNSVSRSDFDSDEEYEQCIHEMTEGSKTMLIENDGDLNKTRKSFSNSQKRSRKKLRNTGYDID